MHQIAFGGLAPPRTADELNPLGVVGKSWEQRNGGGSNRRREGEGRIGKLHTKKSLQKSAPVI